jgi:hypothetical protein
MPQQSSNNGQFLFDGDRGFIGFNSRDNPQTLEQGMLSLCQNFRLNRGIAETRKGLKRLTPGGEVNNYILHTTTAKNQYGHDVILTLTTTKLNVYDINTNSTWPITLPSGAIGYISDKIDSFQAGGKVYFLRGESLQPIIWDGNVTVTVAPTTPSTRLPNAIQGLYINNRGIVQKNRDEISVSHYLELTHWAQLDVFKINDGSNDEIVALAPWVLNEFVIFMKNRIYYASVGAGAYATGDQPVAADSYVKVMATDIGCIAKGSVVQAAGGMLFLSDGGVYMMTPQAATTPEGMRMGVMGEPLSAPIDDIIQRINKQQADKAVGAYFNNRYYLAIPLDTSSVNNVVVVYNFINKQWESIDTFNTGMDVSFMFTAIWEYKRRLFFVDREQGLFLTEEIADGDHYDNSTANNTLPLELPFTLEDPLDDDAFTRFHIDSKLITRSYNFDFSEDKRFSQVEIDVYTTASSQLETKALIKNPDSETVIDIFGSGTTENSTRDLPIRKVGSSCLFQIKSYNNQSSVRSLFVTAVRTGNNIRSTK